MLRKFGFFIIIILLLSIICSCTRTVYQVRDVMHHDSIYVTAVSVDTVMQRDSIHVREKGDTVETTIYKYIYKVRERVDTLYKEKVDTFLEKKTEVKYKTEIVRKTDWGMCVWAFFIGAIVAVAVIVARCFKR